MANNFEACPLRLECLNQGQCPQTSISFDTLDGYPAGVVDAQEYETEDHGFYRSSKSVVTEERFLTEDQALRYGDNDVANNWPLPVCDTSGAQAKEHGLSARDRGWLRKLDGVIQGNTWHHSLREAVEDFPNAAWADNFIREYERIEHPTSTPEVAEPTMIDRTMRRRGWLKSLIQD